MSELCDVDIQELIEETSAEVVPTDLSGRLDEEMEAVIDRARTKLRLFNGRAPDRIAIQAAVREWCEECLFPQAYEEYCQLMEEQGYQLAPPNQFRTSFYPLWKEICERGIAPGKKVKLRGEVTKYVVGIRRDCKVMIGSFVHTKRGFKIMDPRKLEVIS